MSTYVLICGTVLGTVTVRLAMTHVRGKGPIVARTPAPEPEGQAPEDRRVAEYVDSPIPARTRQAQSELSRLLKSLPTLTERLVHLIEHESYFYVRGTEPVTDPAVIAAEPRGLKRKLARVPVIARWVETRTGQGFSKEALYKFRDGKILQLRSSVANALGDFWRIDSRLLDLSISAAASKAPQTEADDLDDLDRRTYELMAEVGFLGVRPREVRDSLGDTDAKQRKALLEVLEAIAHDRATKTHTDPPPDAEQT
jgi:hypothetical protein